MKIAETPYYLDNIRFLQEPPENCYSAFCADGFSYINQNLGLALALRRESKSNYVITLITEDGNVSDVTEHSIATALKRVQTVIAKARRGKGE